VPAEEHAHRSAAALALSLRWCGHPGVSISKALACLHPPHSKTPIREATGAPEIVGRVERPTDTSSTNQAHPSRPRSHTRSSEAASYPPP
jgi:hypothetical protein